MIDRALSGRGTQCLCCVLARRCFFLVGWSLVGWSLRDVAYWS